MLTHLAIRNLALIAAADVTFGPGFTVLTGETGAGKSLLLDALGLALGERAEAGLIRAGASQLDVTAAFSPALTPELTAVLDEHGLAAEEGQLLLRRQLKREEGGKASGKAWVNGTPVPAAVLAQLGAHLFDLHAQHATHQLFKPNTQRDLLDELAGLQAQRSQTAAAYHHWHALTTRYAQASAQLELRRREAELNAAWLAELTELAYTPGEEAELAALRLKAQGAHHRGQALASASAALDESALPALHAAARALQGAVKTDETLDPFAERAFAVLGQLEDLSHDLARHAHAEEADPRSLEELDDRLHALRAAARKHRVDVPELPEVLLRLQTEASGLAALEAEIAHLTTQLDQAQAALKAAAAALSQARAAAMPPLAGQLTAALQALHLPHARLSVQLTPLPAPTAAGAESLELMFTANPGQPPQPLGKVASGGELSRAMLALKSVLFGALPPRTVVLDEVDGGLSGPTAAAVGAAMARLAARHQVLAVTHHPQVAAHAAAHLFISKQVSAAPQPHSAPLSATQAPSKRHPSATQAPSALPSGSTQTSLSTLDETGRIEELARLLAGSKVTPEARAAAAALLAESRAPRPAKAAAHAA